MKKESEQFSLMMNSIQKVDIQSISSETEKVPKLMSTITSILKTIILFIADAALKNICGCHLSKKLGLRPTKSLKTIQANRLMIKLTMEGPLTVSEI